MKKKIQFKAVKPDPAWTPFEVVPPPEGLDGEMYTNSRYHVIVRQRETPLGDITHLSIRRNDRGVHKDWRDFQRIKNELCGPDREAVEMYPAETRLVDTSNQYHLWVLPEGMFFPFGFMERLVTEEERGTKQREFDAKPNDLVRKEELNARLSEERKRLEEEGRVPKELLPHMALAVKQRGG